MPERRVIDECIAFMNSAALDPDGFSLIADKLRDRLPADAAAFLDLLKNVPDLTPFIAGPARAALQQSFAAHLKTVLSPKLAPDFAERSFRIGEGHAHVGLPASWYLMAYGWFLMREVGVIVAECPLPPHQLERALKAFILRVFLDMTCSIQAYEKGLLSKHGDAVKLDDDIQSLKTLADIVGHVNDVAYDLAALSKNTYDGVAHAQEIAADSERFFASSYDISRRTEDATEEATTADACTAKGRSEVLQVSQTMQEVASAVDETARKLDDLAKAAEQGGRILALTDGIARQADQLARSATMEAAAAGPADSNFTHIAHQVKRLAEVAASATEEIAKRVGALETGTGVILDAVACTNAAVSEGKRSVEQACGTMEEISQRVSVVAEKLAEITEFLHEQSKIAYSVAHCVDRVSVTTNESDTRLLAAADKLSSGNARFMQSAQALLHRDSPRSLCEIAKVEHVLLGKLVVDVLMGYCIWPSSEMQDHTRCQHSQWLATLVPPEVRSKPVFRQLEEPHARVHALAKKVLEAHENSDRVAALAALAELRDANADLFKALDDLSEELKIYSTDKPRGEVAA